MDNQLVENKKNLQIIQQEGQYCNNKITKGERRKRLIVVNEEKIVNYFIMGYNPYILISLYLHPSNNIFWII